MLTVTVIAGSWRTFLFLAQVLPWSDDEELLVVRPKTWTTAAPTEESSKQGMEHISKTFAKGVILQAVLSWPQHKTPNRGKSEKSKNTAKKHEANSIAFCLLKWSLGLLNRQKLIPLSPLRFSVRQVQFENCSKFDVFDPLPTLTEFQQNADHR